MVAVSGTALLVMDVQNGIVANFADDAYLPRLGGAVDAARSAGVPLIFVGVRFRAGHPEVSPNNRMWAPVAANNAMLDQTEVTAFAEPVVPRDGDTVVVKKRVGAFAGSDLDMILRAQGITHVVLAGVSTSGVVLSTVRLAADLDYRITVLSDGCLDNDAEVHRVLTEKLFPRQAEVVTVAEWTSTFLES